MVWTPPPVVAPAKQPRPGRTGRGQPGPLHPARALHSLLHLMQAGCGRSSSVPFTISPSLCSPGETRPRADATPPSSCSSSPQWRTYPPPLPRLPKSGLAFQPFLPARSGVFLEPPYILSQPCAWDYAVFEINECPEGPPDRGLCAGSFHFRPHPEKRIPTKT